MMLHDLLSVQADRKLLTAVNQGSAAEVSRLLSQSANVNCRDAKTVYSHLVSAAALSSMIGCPFCLASVRLK